MRVTTAGQTQTIIARLLDSQRRLAEAQQRATSGLRVEKLSDDPTAGSALMQTGGGLRGARQYTRNVERTTASLDAADSALQQLTEVLTRAKQLGVQGNSSNTDAPGRAAMAVEVRQLVSQAVALGNTKLGDEYVFGGTSNDGRAPFEAAAASFVPLDPPAAGAPAGAAGTPRFPTGEREVEAGAGGQRLPGAPDGTRVFLGRTAAGDPDATRGALPALRALAAALEAPDPSGVAPALTALDEAFAGLQATVGEVGARQNRADALTTGLAALDATLTRQKGELGEVDAEQAVTEMLARQTAYQAAMLASSKVMGLSLADYLR